MLCLMCEDTSLDCGDGARRKLVVLYLLPHYVNSKLLFYFVYMIFNTALVFFFLKKKIRSFKIFYFDTKKVITRFQNVILILTIFKRQKRTIDFFLLIFNSTNGQYNRHCSLHLKLHFGLFLL